MSKRKTSAKRGPATKAVQKEIAARGKKAVVEIVRERAEQIKSDAGLHRYWIGADDNPEKRTQILLDDAGIKALFALPVGKSSAVATAVDQITKKTVRIRRAACGLRCYCALEFAPKMEAVKS